MFGLSSKLHYSHLVDSLQTSPNKINEDAKSEDIKATPDSVNLDTLNPVTDVDLNFDRSQYMNRSELPQIDSLAKLLYTTFEQFRTLITEYDSDADFENDDNDVVGYIITPSAEMPFGQRETNSKSKDDEMVKTIQANQTYKKIESLPIPVTNSTYQTSQMSHSKVRLSRNVSM